MTRRFTLILASLAATLALVVGACGAATPAAPALTDPKEILTQSVVSLKDVTTIEFTGGLTGSLSAEGMGSFDLSGATLSGAFDIPGKKGRFNFNAPTLLASSIDAIIVDNAAYYKVAGGLAMMLGGASDKYVKTEVPEDSGETVTDPAEIAKQIDEFKAQLDKLPKAPTKEADEKCGDADCYHVKIALTAEDLAQLSPDAASVGEGDLTLDLWTRKDNTRPAKLSFTVDSPETGTIGMTLEFKYDVTVDVQAPPADQIQS